MGDQEKILVSVAWPYANGSIHLGQTIGAYLPADIFARFHRMKGNAVLMVSGSDAHGTPVVLEAEKQKTTPEKIFQLYHNEFLENWKQLGISFDLFTSTHTKNHEEVVQDIFLKLLKNGFIYKDVMTLPYSEKDKRFLPDRYVEGTCPHCNFESARGDQCDNCGRTLDPIELIDIKSRISGDAPVFKETEHFFLALTKFEKQLYAWIEKNKHWKPNVRNFSLKFLEGGLKDRAITRDIEWGVPVPLDGYEDKRIYVWFDAVIGYLSASIEWSSGTENKSQWEDFWKGDGKSYYFMGKDNIPFHTIIWPSMVIGYGDINLPYDVPANEYLNLEGLKFSTSRGWAIWLGEYLSKFEPDPLRYVLSANMPEIRDTDFSWDEYIRRNNDELVATYGNLVHRVLSLSYRSFDKKIPECGEINESGESLLKLVRDSMEKVSEELTNCRFKSALTVAMGLAQAANKFLNDEEPWHKLKSSDSADRRNAATTLWVVLSVVNCLKILLYPFLPFSSEKLHKLLGFDGSVTDVGWNWSADQIISGTPLPKPKVLFVKIEREELDT